MKYDVIIVGAGPGGIFSAYELIKKKPGLKICVFEEGKKLEVYRGSFGHLREEMIPLMKYSVTFRQEQANMKGFLENTKELLRFLKEKETVFGELVVYGHWQDENIYTCTLTPETKEEDLLYLCVSLKDQPQS